MRISIGFTTQDDADVTAWDESGTFLSTHALPAHPFPQKVLFDLPRHGFYFVTIMSASEATIDKLDFRPDGPYMVWRTVFSTPRMDARAAATELSCAAARGVTGPALAYLESWLNSMLTRNAQQQAMDPGAPLRGLGGKGGGETGQA